MGTAEESGRGLSPEQEAALAALLETGSVHGAAARCGVSRATLCRYLSDPLFLARYREARARAFAAAFARMREACGVAVRVLEDIAADEGAPPRVRAGAAKTLRDWRRSGAV